MIDLQHPRAPQLIIMLSGAVLLVIGVVLIAIQFSFELAMRTPAAPRVLDITKEGAKLTTTYVGLIVVAIGALLEALGYLATRPWQSTPPSN